MKTTIGRLITYSVAGVALLSRSVGAFAWKAPEPITSTDAAKWAVVRESHVTPQPSDRLNPEIARFISGADLDEGLEEAIRRSYAMATLREIAGLDALWIDTLTRRANSAEMDLFIRVRGGIELPQARTQAQTQAPGDGAYYLENWLWKASGNDCDSGPGGGGGNNGWGNGDQDAPGNSENNNGAENQGGNHDGTGDAPGNSGSNGNDGNNGNQGGGRFGG